MTEDVLTSFVESPGFPCQLLNISDSLCNSEAVEAAGPHHTAAPVVSLPLACRTEYSHCHGPSVLSSVCVCLILAKSLLPTPEVSDILAQSCIIFDITLILLSCQTPPQQFKHIQTCPDMSKHIQTYPDDPNSCT